MEVTMFQGRTDHVTVETGGTKDECWLSLKIKNNGEFTLHTCGGDLYELGVKISAAAIAMGADQGRVRSLRAVMPDRLPDETESLIAGIPLPILEGLREYGLHHVPAGGFLHAVLCNNLHEAVCTADVGSLAAIRPIVLYVYNAMPSACWGSPEKVEAWLKLRKVMEDLEFEESDENAVAMPPKKVAPSTDDRTGEPRKKKSS